MVLALRRKVTFNQGGSTLRVLLDGYYLGKPYGFGRFTSELIRALSKAEEGAVDLVVAVPQGVDSEPVGINVKTVRGRTAQLPYWEQVIIPRLANRLCCDVVHSPCNSGPLVTYGIPKVTTVHDLLFRQQLPSVRRTADFAAAVYTRLVFRISTTRSAKIVAVSDTTRRQLQEIGLDCERVYNSIDGFIELKGVPGSAPRQPYILHRGGHHAHRNTARVIRAFRKVQREIPNIKLKVIGVPDGADRWDTWDDSIEFLPRLSDAELGTLYRNARCIVATSLREGFGLPILEGFGFGVPVITSSRDPMKEVAGGAALLVDPNDDRDISSAVLQILTHPSLAHDLVERGTVRFADFQSNRLAEGMLRVYRSAARSA